jgi:tRNA uridine 5-carbamoylmethylation protein Kti12
VTSCPNLRDQIYNSAAQEKTARAEEFSAIKRALSKDNIVIADGLNYIKGYRYQLWCEAKAAGTRCCVVHVAAQEDECKEWNRERLRQHDRECELSQDVDETPTKSGVGKDVMGNMVPESHTAIYGDRAGAQSRSRSSSMDADGGEPSEPAQRPLQDDTMTLKSLYISDVTSRALPTSDIPASNGTTITTFSLPTTPIPTPSSSQPYAPSTFTSLSMRYEPPSPFSRWDTPLFTVPTSDDHPPYQEIWDAIFPPPAKPTSKKALSQLPRSHVDSGKNGAVPSNGQVEEVRQHQATVLPRATSSSALQTLESATLEVVKTLLSAAREQNVADGEGGPLQLSIPLEAPTPTQATEPSSRDDAKILEAEINLPVGTQLSQPALQRLRRKYTQIQRGAIAHGREYAGMRDGKQGVIEGFVGFLQAELEQD